MRDLMNHINARVAFAPAAATTDNTVFTSTILDRQGFDSVTLLIATGSLADVDATFAVAITEGNASDMSDGAAVAAAELLGTTALASFNFAADNACLKLGYVGNKRYVRATVTPANNTGAASVAGVWLLGHPEFFPTANPPN